MKVHDYTKPYEIGVKLYEISQYLRKVDKVNATDIADQLDSIRWELDSYIGADNNEVEVPD